MHHKNWFSSVQSLNHFPVNTASGSWAPAIEWAIGNQTIRLMNQPEVPCLKVENDVVSQVFEWFESHVANTNWLTLGVVHRPPFDRFYFLYSWNRKFIDSHGVKNCKFAMKARPETVNFLDSLFIRTRRGYWVRSINNFSPPLEQESINHSRIVLPSDNKVANLRPCRSCNSTP